jgi:hypothetical protein
LQTFCFQSFHRNQNRFREAQIGRNSEFVNGREDPVRTFRFAAKHGAKIADDSQVDVELVKLHFIPPLRRNSPMATIGFVRSWKRPVRRQVSSHWGCDRRMTTEKVVLRRVITNTQNRIE